MSRPVWPWPATAALTAGADPTKADSWTKGSDRETVAVRDWPGADLFAPYVPAKE